MITFLRKIRRKALTENKFSKYLIYAVGEITLVVIGILIALQIDTWNDKRKESNSAITNYTNLLTALQQDSAQIKRSIKLNWPVCTSENYSTEKKSGTISPWRGTAK